MTHRGAQRLTYPQRASEILADRLRMIRLGAISRSSTIVNNSEYLNLYGQIRTIIDTLNQTTDNGNGSVTIFVQGNRKLNELEEFVQQYIAERIAQRHLAEF